jgi:hypothetical protein
MRTVFLIIRDNVEDGSNYLFCHVSDTLEAAQEYAWHDYISCLGDDNAQPENLQWTYSTATGHSECWMATNTATGDFYKIYEREI